MDGVAKGRGNSSSIVGGIFGENDDVQKQRPLVNRAEAHKGLHGEGCPIGGDFRGGGYGGGYQKPSQAVWDGAAGGRSSNAGQVRDGHFRGGTIKGVPPPGAGERLPSARRDYDPDFMRRLEAVEQHDGWDATTVESSPVGDEAPPVTTYDASDPEHEAIVAAGRTIAQEQGLDEFQQNDLILTLLARHQQGTGFFQFRPEVEEAEPQGEIGGQHHAAGGRSTNAHADRLERPENGHYRRDANFSSIQGGIFG